MTVGTTINRTPSHSAPPQQLIRWRCEAAKLVASLGTLPRGGCPAAGGRPCSTTRGISSATAGRIARVILDGLRRTESSQTISIIRRR